MPAMRSRVAGVLWPDFPDKRSQASLRSALWRINRLELGLITADGTRMALANEVLVDVRAMVAKAHSVIEGRDGTWDDEGALVHDLLPDWYDDWIVGERERLRQLRLHALEALATRLIEAGRHAGAAEVAHAILCDEPFRETAHRILMLVHLAEGNPAEALRQFRVYEELVATELNVEPSPKMQRLVARLIVG